MVSLPRSAIIVMLGLGQKKEQIAPTVDEPIVKREGNGLRMIAGSSSLPDCRRFPSKPKQAANKVIKS